MMVGWHFTTPVGRVVVFALGKYDGMMVETAPLGRVFSQSSEEHFFKDTQFALIGI